MEGCACQLALWLPHVVGPPLAHSCHFTPISYQLHCCCQAMHAKHWLTHSVLMLLLLPEHLPVDLIVSIYILHVTKESLQIKTKANMDILQSAQASGYDAHMHMPFVCV
jgi:hypothetical protein